MEKKKKYNAKKDYYNVRDKFGRFTRIGTKKTKVVVVPMAIPVKKKK
jgi:hypothetical protein